MKQKQEFSEILEAQPTTQVTGLITPPKLQNTEVGKGGGNSGSLSCFPAGSQVLLPNGKSKSIESIQVGDVVLGCDGSNIIPVTVEELEQPLRDHLYVLKFDNGSILRLTSEHPVFTKDGWKSISPASTAKENENLKVERLGIGDRILKVSGGYQILIEMSLIPGEVQTYNLSRLSKLNTYYVNDFLVHNKA